VGGEVTKKGKWNEEINTDFVKNKQKKNEELVSEYYKKYRDTLTWEEKKIELDLMQTLRCYEKTLMVDTLLIVKGNEYN
jgi:hypothetical protein